VANAFITAMVASAAGVPIWPLYEWITEGRPATLGVASGAVAGRVGTTLACG
jgi:Amt family ammonium transporter